MIKRALQAKRQIRFHVDQQLLMVCLGLLSIGYVMVASSSLHLGVKMADDFMHYPLHQLIHIVMGLMVAVVIAAVPLSVWEKSGAWLFIGGLVLLVVVLIPGIGIKVNGSMRWLSLAGLRIQVSEAVKFVSVIYMAGYVVRHREDVTQSAYGLLRPLLLFSIACGLLLKEPDFGSAVVILTIAMGIMYLGGARLQQFLILLALVALLAGLLVWISPYRLARVTAFINPWADARNTGFQLVQALISFGRGEVFGVGLGNGIQKLFYLPEAHTDFLFSVLGEELGLAGVLSVIALFTLLLRRAFLIAAKAERAGQPFAAFVAYGLGIWFGFQAFVNMGVNMGMLPTKGLTLPLMSYGGGSMIVMCAAMAVLFRVNSEVTERLKNAPKGKTEWASAS
ncbi:putative lipid II flippase FtsW [Methylomarinum vadi]|uniref:putative lipid II flippase FtsW n=1 Tax=Methylomarinum vadi TaxID=438855 RepID=UPI0004DF0F17|nr:putative lipid II flippase FtsW [Methylomarinum vadi]